MSLVVQDLSVSFGGVRALGGVTFAVKPDTVTSLIGPNGAGKTTAFNAITGYLRPTAGDIRYGDARLVGLRPCDIAARGVVRTFQKTSLFAGLGVLDNVLTGLHLRGTASLAGILLGSRRVVGDEARLAREAEAILDFVGLAARRDAIAAELASGEQRRLELAVAIAARPRLLLLDEPAAGMTGVEKVEVTRLIQKIREQGVTVFLVEHDMRLVMGVSDHVIVLNHGRVIAEGPPRMIQADPEVIRAYLGTPQRDAAC